MEFDQGETECPSKRDNKLSDVSEPASKKQYTSAELECKPPSVFMSSQLRHTILQGICEPSVFRAGCKWKCIDWTHDDWSMQFSDEVLPLRFGPRLDEGTSLDQPVWESSCTKGEMTYSKLLKWASGQQSYSTTFGSEAESSKHWAYVDYFYMKNLANSSQLREIINWGAYGFPERGIDDSTLWIGTLGANTPCHIDTYGCNLVAQIMGRKRWVLFPKSQSSLLSSTRTPYEESSIYSQAGFPRPSLLSHPKLCHTTPYVVTLEPGDVLFVPKHWWHSVENLNFSISINTWLELPSDEEERVREAIVMYQVNSLCQGIHSLDLIHSVFNPNMTDIAVMGPTQALKILSERVFGCNHSKEFNNKEGNGIAKKPNVKTESDITMAYPLVGDKVAPMNQAGSIPGMEIVQCLSFSHYMQMVYGDKGEMVHKNMSCLSASQNKEAESESDSVNCEQLKLLINVFTDPQVVDVIKTVLDEKLNH
ncbi:hypothetical protein Pmani_010110 [Petrolisthes manimaculis]|uniref:JmjC domain-containing protein n=1 Tax=Petrolisthes manimaculis TaxID=1843537 RepID=A0AAE1UHN7_9EUCA|nr:hypothetical protein Pmani_010110 [Petrolisthes manimaculis]